MNQSEFSEFFVKEGYKIGRSSNRFLIEDFYVYRKINETDFKCSHNKKTPNLVIWLHEIYNNGEYHVSFSMEITAAINSYYDIDDDSEFLNNDWIKLQIYGINWNRLITNFKKLENSLINAWNGMHESESDI